jgi:hypothetical protein
MAKKDDLFLEEEIDVSQHGFTVANGFRFGFGMFLAWLLGTAVVAAAVWGAVVALHLHR